MESPTQENKYSLTSNVLFMANAMNIRLFWGTEFLSAKIVLLPMERFGMKRRLR
jgi:hypothetical protein